MKGMVWHGLHPPIQAQVFMLEKDEWGGGPYLDTGLHWFQGALSCLIHKKGPDSCQQGPYEPWPPAHWFEIQ